jgi:hypothetical protein
MQVLMTWFTENDQVGGNILPPVFAFYDVMDIQMLSDELSMALVPWPLISSTLFDPQLTRRGG